ncbi:hypothetical protein MGLY_06390 [Neomoorella glycerini]|uniref:Uncharacterized protein n=1 Tax=Neomoorella glycerini TaxID=55779 RepID=A0A6I5ZNF2_9FIRM|nr:hypothetical protein [Moorella glycerini]QGP91308.1 hypothetical protein MGLY_06390 [Moorella glycerini]
MTTWRQHSPWQALLITILKINLRNTTGKGRLPGRGLVRLLLAFLVLLSFIPLEIIFFSFFLSLSRASLAVGQPALVPVLIAVAGQTVVLVFGMFYLMSAFYFSRDIDRMLHLPLRPRQLLLGGPGRRRSGYAFGPCQPYGPYGHLPGREIYLAAPLPASGGPAPGPG